MRVRGSLPKEQLFGSGDKSKVFTNTKLGNGLKFNGTNQYARTTGGNGVPYDPTKSYLLHVVFKVNAYNGNTLQIPLSTNTINTNSGGYALGCRALVGDTTFGFKSVAFVSQDGGFMKGTQGLVQEGVIVEASFLVDSTGATEKRRLYEYGEFIVAQDIAKRSLQPTYELNLSNLFTSPFWFNGVLYHASMVNLNTIPSDEQVRDFVKNGVMLDGTYVFDYSFNQNRGNKVIDSSPSGRHVPLINFGSTSNYQGGAWVDWKGDIGK